MSTTIIRAPRRHRFVIIDQRAIEDTGLSWPARGLLGYLLSRPDDLQSGALEKVARLSLVEAQIVIDEWAGCMAAEFIEISPLGYLQAMVRRYQEGDLTLRRRHCRRTITLTR